MLRVGRPLKKSSAKKRQRLEAKSFGHLGERWHREARMTQGTRAVRRTILNLDVLPTLKKRLLAEVKSDDVRRFRARVRGRGTPDDAIPMRDTVRQVFETSLQPPLAGLRRPSGPRLSG